ADSRGVTPRPKPTPGPGAERPWRRRRGQRGVARPPERPADPGDLVIVDYTLTPEGMEPRTETGYAFAIGSGAVMPEIDEAAIGLAPGGTRTTRVRFPAEHRTEELRGKAGDAVGKGTEGKEKVLPALDDDFARTVGSFETLDALRDEMRSGLVSRREQENRRALENAVAEAALAEHPFEVPDALVIRQVGYQVEHMREHVRRQGVDPERLPWDYPKLFEELERAAARSGRGALLVEAIAEKEGLMPDDTAVDAEVERIAESSQRPAPAVRSMLEQNGDLERLRISLMEKRTIDFL